MSAKRKKRKPKRKQPKYMVFWAFVLLVLLTGLPTAYYFYRKKSTKTIKIDLLSTIPEGFTSVGIDVSHHQGKIDWPMLFDELRYDTIIKFVYCKATESNDHLDTRWEENRMILNNMGILNGAYHFFDPKSPPRPQVEHFLSRWIPRDIDLPPMLDVETEGFSDEDLIAKMKIWLTEVERKTGRRPIIYTSHHFFDTKFKHDFKNYNFWIASYSRKPESLSDERVLYWQYSESGKIPGCNEMVDLNVSK
ncbi:MAG: GH25 family lysozyme [Crocinitomicaceae bacterium]